MQENTVPNIAWKVRHISLEKVTYLPDAERVFWTVQCSGVDGYSKQREQSMKEL